MTPQEFLTKIVSIYSPSGREEQLAEFLVGVGKELGFQKSETDRFNNVIFEIGSAKAKKEIVLLGHIDTVPGILPVREEGGVLHGRGVVDAKGSFATFVFAALAVGKRLKNTKVIVAGATEEETSGKGARALIDRVNPVAVIIGEPSHWEGVTLGFKGLLVLEFFQRKTTVHSANLADKNVIESGIAFAEKVRKFAEKFNTGKSVWESLQHRIEKFYFDEVNGIEQVKIKVKFRMPPGFDTAKLKDFVSDCQGAAEVSYLQSWGTEDACLASKSTPVVRAFLQSIRAEGGVPRFKVKTGTSDMNTFMKAFPAVPMVSYGPGDSNLDHTPEERIDLAEFEKAVKILAEVLMKLDNTI